MTRQKISEALRTQAQVLLALADSLDEGPAEPQAGAAVHVDVAKHLAKALPKRRVFEACRAGELKAKRVGRKWIASTADIDAWIAKQTQRPAENGSVLEAWRARHAAH